MDDPFIGTTFAGRFQVEAYLGSGGMAAVYQAHDLAADHRIALKILHAELGDDPEVVARFQREMKATAKVEHPGIVRVYEHGRDEKGRLYLALELLEGRTLDEVIAEDAPLDPERVARMGEQIATALAAAHAHDVMHRDLKPENIILVGESAGQDRVKVFDFGLARFMEAETDGLTAADVRVGTPLYMSPEYIQHYEQDHRGDLYGLGMVLYELSTGATPWEGSPYEILSLAVSEPLTPPGAHVDLPAWLEDVIVHLLAKNPDRRPSSAERVAEALREHKTLAELDRPGPSRGDLVGWVAMAVLAGLAVLALLVVIALLAWIIA